jgi:hypothetical protein
MQLEILCQPDRSLRTTRAALGCRPPNDQSRSGFSTDCRLPCFLSRSLKASTAKAFSVVSFSTASIFSARQPSAFMRTSTDLKAPGSRARGPVVFGAGWLSSSRRCGRLPRQSGRGNACIDQRNHLGSSRRSQPAFSEGTIEGEAFSSTARRSKDCRIGRGTFGRPANHKKMRRRSPISARMALLWSSSIWSGYGMGLPRMQRQRVPSLVVPRPLCLDTRGGRHSLVTRDRMCSVPHGPSDEMTASASSPRWGRFFLATITSLMPKACSTLTDL